MCLLITDNPIQSCLIFTLSEHTYVPNLSSTSQFHLLQKQTDIQDLAFVSLYWRTLLLLCLNSNLKNKRNSSEMLEAHLQPSTHTHIHTEIIRLQKNRKIKKKEKLVCKRRFLSGSGGWCVYI